MKSLNRLIYLVIGVMIILGLSAFSSTRTKIAASPERPPQPPAVEIFLKKNESEIKKIGLIQGQLSRATPILQFLLESKQYQSLAEKNPKELLRLLHIALSSYRISESLSHNLRTTFEFYLKRHFSHDHSFSFEELSKLNLEILTHSLESEKPLSIEETEFLHFIKQQRFYLKRPSYQKPEKYHEGLIVSYDLFAYPALEAYLRALKTTHDFNALKQEYHQLWSSPQGTDYPFGLATELEDYLKKIEPLPASFYKELPIKKSGYNDYIDAPVLENGQFVFFRLTPDADQTSTSNMGDQFLVFSDAYLDDFAVAYLSDQIDPLIRRSLEIPAERGNSIRRTTKQTRYQDFSAMDASGKLSELNSSTASYQVCYQSAHSKHCFYHNTANEIFYGSDIRQAIGLRLILEMRQLNADGMASDFAARVLSKRTLDEELKSFMTGVLHIQALYPAFYPIKSPRYLGVLEESR